MNEIERNCAVSLLSWQPRASERDAVHLASLVSPKATLLTAQLFSPWWRKAAKLGEFPQNGGVSHFGKLTAALQTHLTLSLVVGCHLLTTELQLFRASSWADGATLHEHVNVGCDTCLQHRMRTASRCHSLELHFISGLFLRNLLCREKLTKEGFMQPVLLRALCKVLWISLYGAIAIIVAAPVYML